MNSNITQKMARYSIKDLEQLSGIKAHTIRMWEKRYEIVKPSRTDTNIRYYTDEDLKRILNISILNKSGIRVSSIARLTQDEIRDKVVHLSNNPRNLDSQIENMVVAMLELDEAKFEKLLSRLILQNGFRRTVAEVIFPFLSKIGLLWQTGSINPAQEHFVSNIIRRKFIVAIDSQSMPDVPIQKKFVLFLHENEFHELSLLFYNYVLRRKGCKVIYLGQMVPLEDLIQVVKIKSADFVLTSFITQLPDKEFEKKINALSEALPDKTIFITGFQVKNYTKPLPDNIARIENYKEIEALVEKEQEL